MNWPLKGFEFDTPSLRGIVRYMGPKNRKLWKIAQTCSKIAQCVGNIHTKFRHRTTIFTISNNILIICFAAWQLLVYMWCGSTWVHTFTIYMYFFSDLPIFFHCFLKNKVRMATKLLAFALPSRLGEERREREASCSQIRESECARFWQLRSPRGFVYKHSYVVSHAYCDYSVSSRCQRKEKHMHEW